MSDDLKKELQEALRPEIWVKGERHRVEMDQVKAAIEEQEKERREKCADGEHEAVAVDEAETRYLLPDQRPGAVVRNRVCKYCRGVYVPR